MQFSIQGLNEMMAFANGQIVLQPIDNNASPFVLEEENVGIFPLFPEFSGQLMTVVGFVKEDRGFMGGPHFENSAYKGMPRFRALPTAQVFFLGRLAAEWNNEPIVEKGKLLLPTSMELTAKGCDVFTFPDSLVLSAALRRLEPQLSQCGHRVELFLGTEGSLRALHRHLFVERFSGISDNHIEALFELGVGDSELELYVPQIVIAIVEMLERDARKNRELDEQFATARKAFAEAVFKITAERNPIRARERTYKAWKELQSRLIDVSS